MVKPKRKNETTTTKKINEKALRSGYGTTKTKDASTLTLFEKRMIEMNDRSREAFRSGCVVSDEPNMELRIKTLETKTMWLKTGLDKTWKEIKDTQKALTDTTIPQIDKLWTAILKNQEHIIRLSKQMNKVVDLIEKLDERTRIIFKPKNRGKKK
jgi:hypothetical protein